MKRTSKAQVMFTAGELSPLLAGRSDIEKVTGGCRVIENMVLAPEGPAVRRAGTEYIASLKGTQPGGADYDVPLWHGYHYYDGQFNDLHAYEVFFGGTLTLSADGRVRFVGSIRAGNRGLGGGLITVPYQVLVAGSLVTIASAQTNFNPVAVDVTLAAGSLDTLRFPGGYIQPNSHDPDWELFLVSYSEGLRFPPFNLPFDPATPTAGHAVTLRVGSLGDLEMDGRCIDSSAFSDEQAALYTYVVANLATAERAAELIHVQQVVSGTLEYLHSRTLGSRDLIVFLAGGSNLGSVSFPLGAYIGPFSG